jgi:ABC-2 type transport system ATP-binding protein
MSMVEVNRLSYAYGRVQALQNLDLTIPAGALYALVGPNGSGKTTLMQVLLGLRRAQSGRASVLGRDCATLTAADRACIGYIAEGQALPGSMCLREVEAFLAPLYPTWDTALARDLRERFALDPARKFKTFSRGEQMKAALLCALTPRPTLLVMDEPFTGMDALVRDDLVRGLLQSAGAEGWTVLLCSHDIAEVEMLADWVGFLQKGRMRLSEPMDQLHQRFKHVDVQLADGATVGRPYPAHWFTVEQNGRMISFIAEMDGSEAGTTALRDRFAGASRLDVRDATLREVFIALARHASASDRGMTA